MIGIQDTVPDFFVVPQETYATQMEASHAAQCLELT